MKSIVFYSFKGGVGRSLAIAQLAVILARFGKSVFVIDFDLEAPGLQEKFKHVIKDKKLGTQELGHGLVYYIKDYINGLKSDKTPLEVEPLPLELAKGKIRLWWAGDPFTSNYSYWKVVSDPKFHEFMSYFESSENFFDRLKNKILVDYNPDFLLIDSRSGANELSGICTRVLADTVVLFSPDNVEGVQGAKLLIDSFKQSTREDRKPIKTHFVLSRVPHFYFDDGKVIFVSDARIGKRKAEIQGIINRGLSEEEQFDQIYVLRTDPFIALKEDLPIKLHGKAGNSILVSDYINFFSALIPDVKEDLKKLIEGIQTIRPFMFEKELGKMINPQDSAWNVAFRVDTLASTFESIYIGVYDREKERIFKAEKEGGRPDNKAEKIAVEEAKRIAAETLFKAGTSASEKFSNFLKDSWNGEVREGKEKPSTKSKLDSWCEFDSDVGFGVFENEWDEDSQTGKIILKNNFLIYGRPKEGNSLCDFMRGYIKIVLDAIFYPTSIDVHHDPEKHCGQKLKKHKDDDPQDCVFHFKLLKK